MTNRAENSTDERQDSAASPLRRSLGLVDAVGIGFGAIVGAGIFVVTGIAAGMAGPAFLISLLIAALAAASNALSSAQLAAHYPYSGGTYEYGYRVFNPWAGFAAGWMFLASKIAAAGTVAIGLAGYLGVLLPALSPRAVAAGAVVAFTAVSYFAFRNPAGSTSLLSPSRSARSLRSLSRARAPFASRTSDPLRPRAGGV